MRSKCIRVWMWKYERILSNISIRIFLDVDMGFKIFVLNFDQYTYT